MADLAKIDKIKKSRLFMPADAIVFGTMILLVAILLTAALTRPEGSKVEVYIGNRFYAEYPLDTDAQYTLHSQDGRYSLILNIKDGKAFITESSCPDHICEYPRGGISLAGQSLVCAPAVIVVRVSGERASGLDGEV